MRALAALALSVLLAVPAWAGRAVVAWELVNVRASPRIEEENRVGQLVVGTEVEVLEERDDWIRVRHPGGEGWVTGRSLRRLAEPSVSSPAAAPAEPEPAPESPAALTADAESPRLDAPETDSETRSGGYLTEYTDEPDLPTAGVGTSVLEAVAALFLVLALIGGAVWLIRRFMGPRFLTSRRAEGIRVLATRPLGSRHGLLLVEAGGLVWLLSQSPDGARLIAEIRDPEALRRLDDRYEFLEVPFESELRRQLDESPEEAPAIQPRAGEETPEPSPEERLAALRRRPRPGGRG